MTNKRNDKNIKAAISTPRDWSNYLAMNNDSSRRTSHAQTASYPSASVHSQVPLQTDGFSQRTDLIGQFLHNKNDTTGEHPTPTTYSSIGNRQQNKSHQHSVAEQGMDNLATAHSRTQENQVNNSHVQEDRDPRTKEQLQKELREKETQLNDLEIQSSSLATENEQCIAFQEQLQTQLAEKEQELKDITDEKDRKIEEICQLWKQAAKDLEKCQTQDKVVDQVTDPEVIAKARLIQYNVRNSAYQHFDGELNTMKNVQSLRQCLQECLQISPDFVEACIKSPVKCPMLVGACVWGFLLKNIFEKYWWGGTKVHRGMVDLTKILSKPCQSADLAEWSEAKRKYQMWKANTSTLLVNALELDREEGQDMSGTLTERAQDFCAQLAPLPKSKRESFTAQILDITREALDLDQLLSKQVADIYWTVSVDGPKGFTEASMEIQQAEKRAVEGQQVQLVVAPGLIKRGRSTGEDYEMTNILLKTTVSCEPITTDNPGESHKSSLPKSQKSSRFPWITEPLKGLRHDSLPRVRD